MAQVETTTEQDRGLTTQVVTGTITIEELTSKINEFYQGQTTPLILWDFTNASLTELSYDQIHQLAADRQQVSRPRGKTALVVTHTADYGIGRMVQIFSELRSYDFEVEIFTDIASAKAWLGLP